MNFGFQNSSDEKLKRAVEPAGPEEEAQDAIFLERSRSHNTDAHLVFPFHGPQVEQPDQIGFGGLLETWVTRRPQPLLT